MKCGNARPDPARYLPGLFFCLLFWSSFSAHSVESLPYPVLDSKVMAPRTGGSVHWLDNQRVVFMGYREAFEEEEKLRRTNPFGKGSWLGIWDVGSGGVRVYKRGVEAIHCFNSTTQSIIYTAWNDKAQVSEWFAGRFLEEKSLGVQNISLNIDLLECAYPRKQDYPGELRGKKYVTKLLEGQGYLWPSLNNVVEFIENTPIGLYDAQGHKVAELPFGHRQAMSIQYYQFKQAYFLFREEYIAERKGPAPLRNKDTHIGWWLYQNGKIEEAHIPSRAPIATDAGGSIDDRNTVVYFPTSRGIFFNFYGLVDRGGGLLAREGKLEKVISGTIYRSVAVSPDGCKVAFLHNSSPTKQLREWIKAIDLCQSPPGNKK